jgi:hypothetical protein
MALYTDEPVYEGVGTCRAAPCVGWAAVRREIERQVADNARITLLSAEVAGNTVTGRWQADATRIRLAGVERIVGSDTIEVGGDKIATNRVVYDATDPQTAILIDWLETQTRYASRRAG